MPRMAYEHEDHGRDWNGERGKDSEKDDRRNEIKDGTPRRYTEDGSLTQRGVKIF